MENLEVKMDPMFEGCFNGKTVLITGHTGFKGAWLALWLHLLGSRVVGYSLKPPTEPNFFEQCRLSQKIVSCEGDVCDLESLKAIIAETKPEIVFHLAAQPLVRVSYRKPVETIFTNLIGTVHVLEAVREAGSSVRVCQLITSDKSYQNRETEEAYCETDPMGGHDPYSASKGGAELMISAYRNSFFHPDFISEHQVSVSSARGGNVIGGGDWGEDRILPDCIRALSQDKPIVLRNPAAIRPWQYILDALSGYLCLAQYQLKGDSSYASAWNIGPDENEYLRVQELAERVIRCWGKGSWNLASPNHSKMHEATLLKLNCTKAKRELKWRCVYNFEESIRHTVDWYKKASFDKHFDAFNFSVQQIKNYQITAKERRLTWAHYQEALP